MLVRLYTVLEKEISQILQKRLTLAASNEPEKNDINYMFKQIAKINATADHRDT